MIEPLAVATVTALLAITVRLERATRRGATPRTAARASNRSQPRQLHGKRLPFFIWWEVAPQERAWQKKKVCDRRGRPYDPALPVDRGNADTIP